MMTHIKHFMSFLLGALYASGIWIMVTLQQTTWLFLAATAVAFSLTLLLLTAIVRFFVVNWGKR